MPDRLSEHPNLIVCVTNMAYKTAPGLLPKAEQDINWYRQQNLYRDIVASETSVDVQHLAVKTDPALCLCLVGLTSH